MGNMKKPSIGIIGGTGKIGSMFRKFFEKRGLKVQIASRNTDQSVEACAGSNDIVIVSVPIDKTVETIKKIGHFVKKESLLMDFTSLKTDPINAMLEYSKASVLGTHPMFGPGIKSLKGQTIVLCKGRGSSWFEWVNDFFINEKSLIKICTAKEHDRMMAFVQALVHFNSIASVHVLKEFDIDISDSLDYSSPNYKNQLGIISRVFNQDPGLYAGIEIDNPEAYKVLKTYMINCIRLMDIIKKKDKKGFTRYFEEASAYLLKYYGEISGSMLSERRTKKSK
jgi:prephenate dehydrogenase